MADINNPNLCMMRRQLLDGAGLFAPLRPSVMAAPVAPATPRAAASNVVPLFPARAR